LTLSCHEVATFVRRLRIVAFAALLALAAGVIFAVQYRGVMAAAGHPVSFASALLIETVPWLLWALFLPVILEVPERWPASVAMVRLLAINFLVGLSLTALHLLVSSLVLRHAGASAWALGLGFPPGLGPVSVAQVAGGLMLYGLLVGLAYMEHYRRAFHDGEVRSAQLEAQVVTAELNSLRAQLCPHFLFNTLNSVCGLIPGEPERAELMIAKLSQLLRLALQSDGIAEVPLAKELEFAAAYLDVERVRFEDRLQVSFDVDPNLRSLLVPNFLLQPLVENAVHHAVALSRDPRLLELAVHRHDGTLVIEVRDDGPGLAAGALERRRDAIGLSTTRARLEHLYGSAFRFTVQNRPEGGAVARVVMPLRVAAAAAPPISRVA
jgi:signal transduction histidine kinase